MWEQVGVSWKVNEMAQTLYAHMDKWIKRQEKWMKIFLKGNNFNKEVFSTFWEKYWETIQKWLNGEKDIMTICR
jgi:hypothetical protein